MPLQEEVDLGNELSAGLKTWAVEDPRDTQYVTHIAQSLTPHVRRQGIPYQFHVVESPSINAFALPGGHIYVLRGMLDFLQNEAELAAILGHEIGHVDLRHCVERYQYKRVTRRVGELGQAIDIARILVLLSYGQYQELEADAEGARLAVDAGYDPAAAEAVFSRLEAPFGEVPRPASTSPVGELNQAMEHALSDYFRSHPRSAERARRIHAFAAAHSEFKGRQFYVGRSNYATRTPRSSSTNASEVRTY
jgi:predicted Zn-dependent protease